MQYQAINGQSLNTKNAGAENTKECMVMKSNTQTS